MQKGKNQLAKLVDQLDEFFISQQETWPLLKNNVEALGKVKIKKFQFEKSTVEVHFNPERIKSSSAKVDKKSIEERPCFLCDENRPVEQGHILFLGKWKILCNPYPVLKKHFTVVRTSHIPQLILNSFEDMLLLAKEMSNKFTIFYNGPAHGASAPDHLHFQAVASNILPIEKLINDSALDTKGKFHFYEFLPQKFYLMMDENLEKVKAEFENLYQEFGKSNSSENEPGLNIIVKHESNKFIVIVFARKKHRPACFFYDEPKRILISPATIDMAGIFVLPRIEDLHKVSETVIKNIFDEVLA